MSGRVFWLVNCLWLLAIIGLSIIGMTSPDRLVTWTCGLIAGGTTALIVWNLWGARQQSEKGS